MSRASAAPRGASEKVVAVVDDTATPRCQRILRQALVRATAFDVHKLHALRGKPASRDML